MTIGMGRSGERSRRRGPAWAVLAALLAAHVTLGLAYGLTMPLFETPDEAGHYLFVRYVQAYGGLPVQTAVFDAPRAHHPPLYFWLAAGLTHGVAIDGSPDSIHMTPNPHFGFRLDDPYPDNKAVYLHNGPEERWPFAGQARAVHLIRLLSLAFSTLAVAATFGAAWALRPGALSFATLAAGLVAFNPMVLIMAGQVSNDTSALASGAVIVCLLSMFTRRGFTVGRPARAEGPLWVALLGWVVVGLALAAALLLKTSTLLLGVPIVIVAAGLYARPGRWMAGLRAMAAVAAPPLLLSGWWFWRNVQLYGDLSGNDAVALVNGRVPANQQWVSLWSHLGWLAQGTLGCAPLGPLSACFPTWMYLVAGGLALAALIGLALYVRRRGWPIWQTTTGRLWLAHGVLVSAVVIAVLVYALSFWNAWSGRLLFPAFASSAMLLAAGGLAWVTSARARVIITGAVLAASVALAVYGVVGIIQPRYGTPRSPSAAELRAMTPLDAQLGETARVLGYHLDTAHAQPGGTLDVTIYWQPLAVSAVPYSVFLHLYDPALGSLAQRDTYPGLGNYATTLWEPGRVFADTYRLYLPPETPATSDAYLLLGLYDEVSGERLPAIGADTDGTENWIAFGAVTVGP